MVYSYVKMPFKIRVFASNANLILYPLCILTHIRIFVPVPTNIAYIYAHMCRQKQKNIVRHSAVYRRRKKKRRSRVLDTYINSHIPKRERMSST